MTLGSLFAGIGGFELAATWAGIEPVWSNEIDNFACKVLRKNFDHEIIQEDIREIGSHNLRPVDIISGGFPCQPFSEAGKQKGTDDDRYLWPEMLRIIKELKPKFVVGENVAGLLTMDNGKTLRRILDSLEDEGYNNEIFAIPACSLGAWHKRERLWILAHSNGNGHNRTRFQKTENNRDGFKAKENIRTRSGGSSKTIRNSEVVSNTKGKRLQGTRSARRRRSRSSNSDTRNGQKYWSTEPNVGRVADGISGRVDRIKGLGNAIVPQVAYEIFKAIVEIENK